MANDFFPSQSQRMTLRQDRLALLRERATWDLIVIGGGATGLGTAVDAASRGYKTLLLEAHDFAKGTSSRSTKLVHGGVRYLAQGRVGLVREALIERKRLLRNAPRIVHPRSFLIPAYTRWERPYYGLGLWLYDRLAGDLGLLPSRSLGRDETLLNAPNLQPTNLRGAIFYQDAQFDDARLAIALLSTLDHLGGTALNALAVNGIRKNAGGQVAGVQAQDAETGETFELSARGVINATGVFADAVRKLDQPQSAPMLAPSQGAHVVLDPCFLPGETAILIPRTDDGRVLFAIPWNDRVLLGTTDTPVKSPAIEPRALPEELSFLLYHARRYLTVAPEPNDVLSVFAGLRPLIAPPKNRDQRTSRLSREHALLVSPSGLVTITGGKWTTYRLMAEQTIDLAARTAGLPTRPCVTADLPLLDIDILARDRLLAEHPELGSLIHPRLSYRSLDVVWAVREESARTIEDVLARRTRALFLDARAAMEAAPLVASLMARELLRDDRWADQQVSSFRQLASGYLFPG